MQARTELGQGYEECRRVDLQKDRRAAFERSPTEKWEYEHVGDWRFPLPFELGFIFGAIPKAAVYEMNGDEGAMKSIQIDYRHEALPGVPLAMHTLVEDGMVRSKGLKEDGTIAFACAIELR